MASPFKVQDGLIIGEFRNNPGVLLTPNNDGLIVDTGLTSGSIVDLQVDVLAISAAVSNISGDFATNADLIAVSGSLQNQIDSIDILPGSGISVVESPSLTWTVSVTGDFATTSLVAGISADLQTQINNNTTLINTVSGDLDALEAQVGDISGNFATISLVAGISGDLQTQIDNNTTLINTVSGDLDTLESQVAGLTGVFDNRYVNITGDTMTGALTVGSDLTVTGDTTVQDLTVQGDAVVIGRTDLLGPVTAISGTITWVSSENLVIDDNIIRLNNQEVSGGPGVSLRYSGLEINRGPGEDFASLVFDEVDDGWYIGNATISGGSVASGTLDKIATEDFVNSVVGATSGDFVQRSGDTMTGTLQVNAENGEGFTIFNDTGVTEILSVTNVSGVGTIDTAAGQNINIGNATGRVAVQNEISVGSLTPANSGNFLTYDENGVLVDSGFNEDNVAQVDTGTLTGLTSAASPVILDSYDTAGGDNHFEWLVGHNDGTNWGTDKVIAVSNGITSMATVYGTLEIGETDGIVFDTSMVGSTINLVATISDNATWEVRTRRVSI